MRVLVACEFSGRVRDAFIGAGHDAWSCDIESSERSGPHIQDNVLRHLDENWDLMIAHPPCTYLAISGARWWKDRSALQDNAIAFCRILLDAPIERIALENPIGKLSSAIRKPDQVIHPWMFGDEVSKATCLWLKNLPQLVPTNPTQFIRRDYIKNLHYTNRSRNRSRTFWGIARAMANQWG